MSTVEGKQLAYTGEQEDNGIMMDRSMIDRFGSKHIVESR